MSDVWVPALYSLLLAANLYFLITTDGWFRWLNLAAAIVCFLALLGLNYEEPSDDSDEEES